MTIDEWEEILNFMELYTCFAFHIVNYVISKIKLSEW